jgi:sigma-E factor negative regulatory protein RseA
MNEQKREQLSALVDNELTHETSSAINTLLEDNEARETWARYHLIGDSMRGHLPEHVEDVADNVSQAIAAQPTIFTPQKKSPNRKSPDLMKPVMGFAIAASVAAVAIFNVQQANQRPAASQQVIAQSSIATTPPSLTVTPQFATQQKEQTQAQQYRSLDPRLSRYLVNYNEYRVNTGVRGMPPHVRMVANETGSKK